MKEIKSINSKLVRYQLNNLEMSANYQAVINQTQLRGGELYINSRGFTQIRKGSMSESDINFIFNMPYLKEELDKAKELGFKSRLEQIEHIKSFGLLKSWTESNLDFLYQDVIIGVGGDELLNMFDKGMRNYSYAQIEDAIKRYEKIRQEAYAEAEDSDFNVFF